MVDWQACIREIVPGDIAAMIALFRSSVRIVARRDYGAEQVLAWAPDDIDPNIWSDRYRKRAAWCADVGGVLAGFTDLEPDGHLDMMYVHPDFQGRGIATALLARAEMEARSSGMVRIRTEASITARPFFERRGFEFVARQTVSRAGQELVNFRMEKGLT